MSRPARVSRQDWLDLGGRLLASEGPQGITIERLTREAGATRGSFYHHFDGMPGYVDALVDDWSRTATEGILAELDATSPAERRVRLTTLAYALDPAIERGIRRLAEREPRVAERIAGIDSLREQTIARLVESDFGADAAEAATVGRLLNTLFVGVMHQGPADPHAFAAGALKWVEQALADRRR